MSNVIPFCKGSKDIQEILNEASDLRFQSVVIVGTTPDGVVHLSNNSKDVLSLLGALEAAKMHVYEGWNE